MTDPWEDTLPKVKMGDAVRLVDQRWAYYPDGVKDLRADANALLAVTKAAQEWNDKGGFYLEVGFWEALAALPEHLRGAPND